MSLTPAEWFAWEIIEKDGLNSLGRVYESLRNSYSVPSSKVQEIENELKDLEDAGWSTSFIEETRNTLEGHAILEKLMEEKNN